MRYLLPSRGDGEVPPVRFRVLWSAFVTGLVCLCLVLCAPGLSMAKTVGLILPKDCAFNSDVKDKISSQLGSSGIKGVEVLMQRPGSDKVSRLNSIRKFLAYGTDAIVIWGGTSINEIAGEAGKTPIIFVGVWDPVKSGVVKDLKKPGKYITGVVGKTSTAYLLDNIAESAGKGSLGIIYHSDLLDSKAQYEEVISIAPGKGFSVLEADLSNTSKEEVPEILQPADFLFLAQGCDVQDGTYGALADLNKPAATHNPGVSGGGVIFTLAPDMEETIKVVSQITGRVLKGEKPGDIPVSRIRKISFTINVGEARRLGVKIPFGVLNRGTEVIR